MSKHTPGPWIIYKRADHPDIQVEHVKPGDHMASAFNQGVCDLSQFECRARPEEAMANARLIAAAPMLASILRNLVETLKDRKLGYLPPLNEARILLAKIDGAA